MPDTRQPNENKTPLVLSEDAKDRASPKGCRYNLDDAWIVIDGVRHNVVDLLRRVDQQLKK